MSRMRPEMKKTEKETTNLENTASASIEFLEIYNGVRMIIFLSDIQRMHRQFWSVKLFELFMINSNEVSFLLFSFFCCCYLFTLC